MAKKAKTLESQLLRPGTKFVVNGRTEDSTYGPGTTGFVSFVKGFDQDFPNVAYLVCSIIRRGKGGKPRVEKGEISTPIFDLQNKTLSENMPDEKRRFYVHITKHAEIQQIHEMDTVEFLGWAFAMANFVYKLGSTAKHFKPWPSGKKNLLNLLLYAENMWNESAGDTVAKFESPEIRQDFGRRIRLMESTLVKPSLAYMAKLAGLEKSAAQQLSKLHKKSNPAAPKAVITRTMNNAGHLQDRLVKQSKRLTPVKKVK